MGKLFGTDGVRGIANGDLTPELAMKIGKVAAAVLAGQHAHPNILIGMDTRISSQMLESALAAGLCSVGANAVLIGVVPTPAVAYLVGALGADAGIMISASHNPCEYNGIKLFGSTGFKLSDELEDEIEKLIAEDSAPRPTGGDLGRIIRNEGAVDKYIAHLASAADTSLEGIEVALDCANGSAAHTAEKLFSSLGAKCHLIGCSPDGININKDCGSTDLTALSEYVKNNHLPLGIAFDGDADRCLAIDENGEIVDGDKLIAIFSNDMKCSGKLKENTAVMTVMSNLGFFHFARNNSISVKTTQVGDRYVLEEMLRGGYNIGGEQSGHIIFLDHASTGDGQLSGLRLLCVLRRSGKKLSELAAIMDTFPQKMVNITADTTGKALLKTDAAIIEAIRSAEERLGDDGRILVRASGTEPLIRVMAEGKALDFIENIVNEVCDVIRATIGK